MDKLEMKTARISQENIEKIRGLFPNAVTEIKNNGKVELAVDFDVLKQELSDSLIEAGQERYQMTWPDKKKSVLLANSAISATLRPCREESVNFDTTQNLYIEGDNLDVLKLLRETYLGKVKMIYIDPPYNTGNDFVYEDDFAQSADDYKGNSGQYDEQGNRLVKNLDSNGRFHTDWLNMMYPRLKVARDLLSDDGIIFISIDDNEQANLLKMCDEIFGEKQRAGIIHRRKNRKPHNAGNTISLSYEFILVYYKNKTVKLIQEYASMEADDKGEFAIYPVIKADKKKRTYVIKAGTRCDCLRIEARVYHAEHNENLDVEYLDSTDVVDGRTVSDVRLTARYCLTDENGKFSEAMKNDNIFINANGFPKEKRYRLDGDSKIDNHHWDIEKGKNEDGDDEIKELFLIKGINNIFQYPKPIALVKKILSTMKEQEYLVLDFFSGSATTAHAVMQLNAEDGGNRKFIMVQLPEKCDEKSEAYKAGYKNICEIGKERIRRAGKKIKEETGKTDLDTGFRVLKLDSSNMQDVFYNPAAMTQDLLSTTIDNVKPDRTPMDLLFQIMLELGVQLSAKIEEKEICGKKYYVVNENEIIACFDDNLNNDVITEIAKQQPLYAVFKDKSFATDSVGINNEQLFKTYSPTTEVKVI